MKLRGDITEDEMNDVLFKKERALNSKSEDLKVVPSPSLMDVKIPMKKGSSKWVDHLSGADAQVKMIVIEESECNEETSECEEIRNRKDASVVGIVVNSDDVPQGRLLAGRFEAGSFNKQTPALHFK